MTANPLVQQGTLNRLRASVLVPLFPQLNVTAPYLGKEGIRLSLEGEATLMIPTMVGTVTSPEPYQMCTCTLHLLKTQQLGNLWKLQQELLSVIGPILVTPDASPLSPYPIQNCGIASVSELNMAGNDAGYVVTVKGFYTVNLSLFGV